VSGGGDPTRPYGPDAGADPTQPVTRPGAGADTTQAYTPPTGGPPPPPGGYDEEEPTGRSWWTYALIALLLGALVGIGIAVAVSGDDKKEVSGTSTSSTSTSTTTTTTVTLPPSTSPPSTSPSPPGQVTGLSAGPGGGSGEVSLSWNAVPGATSYRIYRSSTSGVSGSLIATETDTDYTDVPGAPAYYQVSAVNAGGEGPRSAEACGAPIGESC
jgi:hypothetical protein